MHDARVIQYKREIKILKEKVELQSELNRSLEKSNHSLQDKLESYKKRCSDLQKNLDDKDQHLNEVVASLTQAHQVLVYTHVHTTLTSMCAHCTEAKHNTAQEQEGLVQQLQLAPRHQVAFHGESLPHAAALSFTPRAGKREPFDGRVSADAAPDAALHDGAHG